MIQRETHTKRDSDTERQRVIQGQKVIQIEEREGQLEGNTQ